MFRKKRKILFASEASFANTGFASIYRELISRIYADGRFRVAEFGSDALVNDPRDTDIHWRFYANSVQSNDPRYAEYKSYEANKFGSWRFDKVLLDFEPDIVIDLRDPPFFQHESLSPLMPYYHWCISPTVDSSPQLSEWIDIFLCADSVLPYTDYGYNVLKNTHPGIKLVKGMGPGVNTDTFHMKKKTSCRAKLGVNESSKILGYVSRNQGRKQIPKLIQAFKGYLDQSGDTDTYLHLHTTYPDLHPWNIPKVLIEQNVYDRVLFTYYCISCQHTFICKWKDAVTPCYKCGKQNALHPRTSLGCDVDTMVDIFNCYDLYIQYSTCEGLGLGMLEAAACGVPVMAVDYSAMEDLNKNLGGIPIKFDTDRDIHTDAFRAIPDLNHTIDMLLKHLSKPREILARAGFKCRDSCVNKYNWDDIANKWISYLDQIKLKDNEGNWGATINTPPKDMAEDTAFDRIKSMLAKSGREDLTKRRFVQDLYYHNRMFNAGLKQLGVSQQDVSKILYNNSEGQETITRINLGIEDMKSEDFIRYADIKEISHIDG